MRAERERIARVGELAERLLKPLVRRIDADAFYPEAYLRGLGEAGLLTAADENEAEIVSNGALLIEETSKICMTTGFNLWCHLAALTYVRHAENNGLREALLPQLENGGLLGGTGLSNPMKFYAGLDKLYLRAERRDDGYAIHGTLPMVSNLGDDHWFGIVADCEDRRVTAFVPCKSEGLTRIEQVGFLGLNGSATYSCRFDGVLVPSAHVLSETGDVWVERIRPTFVLYQIPLGLGLIASSADAIRDVRGRQGGCNGFLHDQADDLERDLSQLRERLYALAAAPSAPDRWSALVRLRLDVVYAALRAVQAGMLHSGSPGYRQDSDASRRLREAYFLANLTPTVRHLEKMAAALP